MPNQSGSNKTPFIRNLLLLVLFLSAIAIYLQTSFPSQLKHIRPQKFQSHPVRNLSSEILSFKDFKLHHYDDTRIGLCEDVEVNSKGVAYCVNEKSDILQINFEENKIEKLGQADKGISYGSRLSRDQTMLYFINSELGLCSFNFQTKMVKSLVSSYNNSHLLSLNSIQTHPTDASILYITQSNPHIPMYLHTIDILLNNPLGRLYQFNITSGQLTLITDGFYFPNGIVYQLYKGQETLLLAETNRFRILRVFLSGQKRGQKQVAIDKLDLFLDNMKASNNGVIWIAGPSMRDQMSYFADWHPIVRLVISRLPHKLFPYLQNTPYFGGLKISFTQQNEKHELKYYLWKSLPKFTFATTISERNGKLFLSSLLSRGIAVIEGVDKVQKNGEIVSSKVEQSQGQDL